MKFTIKYDSEYCGCDMYEEVEADSRKEAELLVDIENYRVEIGLESDDEIYVDIEVSDA